jgi:hypothetical protein
MNENFNLLIFDDPAFLAGTSLKNIFEALLKVEDFKYLIMNEIGGFGKEPNVMSKFLEKMGEPILLDSIIDDLNLVQQFEWGDFFLFKNYPENWIDPDDYNYVNLIKQTDTTVRAVDNQYIYIYTPNDKVVEAISNQFTLESIKQDVLENLEFPY